MPARPSPLTRDILLAIANKAVGFWGVFERPYSITYPLYKDIERLLRKASYDTSGIRKTIHRLVYRKYLEAHERNGETVLVFTERGAKRVRSYRIQEIGIPEPRRWDGKWRVVIFDIPDKAKTGRELLRAALKRLGLQLLQESVAIHPHPCRDEVYALATEYRVLPYIRLLEVCHIDDDGDIREAFALVKREEN